MPLFHIQGQRLEVLSATNFASEKQIQTLIESNLGTVFGCRFVATEFRTGSEHAGRIDTLALSEDDNPVIIEYKKIESSELINQSLYYLSWIRDHRGDFQVAVNKALNKAIDVDWSEVRVICLAPGYRKYDLHAVQVMGANIELWQYRLFQDGSLYLEEVFRRTKSLALPDQTELGDKDPVMVAAGKKAALTRATGSYTFEQHLLKTGEPLRDVLLDLKDFILGIDEAVEEAPKKFYIAYKVAKNFVCVEVQKQKIFLYLKLNPNDVGPLPSNARDVSEIGHFGTGDLELRILNIQEAHDARKFIEMAYERVGGG